MGFLKSLGKAALGIGGSMIGGGVGGALGGGGLVGKAIGGLIGKKGGASGASGGPSAGGLGDMVRRQTDENISNPVGFSGKRIFDRSSTRRARGRSMSGRR